MSFGIQKSSGHPVSIKDEGVTIVTDVSSINAVGAGVTASAIGPDVTLTVPGGGSSLSKETPTPAVDGVTVAFSVTNLPKFVQLNGAIQEDGGVDYTRTGSGPYTITFLVAPTAGSILRSYY